ncbi:uncharacterized protein LOC143059659 [Mytilus galloprovincialis]|uniref:uncharacterized protein LOC143059659 n=1 Tax=Mytilus galloprovincialis TaxID=29158 RepID=UPI003F7BD5A2
MKFFSFVFVLWIPNIACFLRWSSNDNVEYKEEIPVEISQGQRTRRSTDDSFHPQTYDLDLKVEGSQVHFHLERNDDINTNVPTLSLSQGVLTDIYLQEQKESIFYQDIKNGASFVVQQDKMHPESMFGTFNSGGDSFILQSPKERLSSLHSGSNRFELIKEIRNRTEFGDGLKSGDNFKSLPVRKHHRQKRATGSNQVELLIVCDYAIYNYWLGQSEASTPSEKETEALTSVRQYYAFVLNGMDAMYKNIQTTDYTISVLFAGIVIAQTPNDAPWTESIKNTASSPNTVDSLAALNKFTAWIQANSSHLPERDHSMLFSRYDLSYNGNNGNAGLAFTGAICSVQSQSIVQDEFNFIIITVAAHELGHSLSAQHDGYENSCDVNGAYIMASSSSPQQGTTATHPWIFSTCSTDYFRSQIDELELSGESNNCMKTLGSNFDPTALTPYDQSLAGQVYDADAQCSHIYGDGSNMCRGQYSGNFESICNVLWCSNQDGSSCFTSIAGEGTLCGNKKWCVSGVCTSDSNAPSGNENCLYGDRKGVVFNDVGWTCAQMYILGPHNCDNTQVQQLCCASCNPETTTIALTTEAQTTTTKLLTTTDYLTTTESFTTTEPLTTTKSVTTTEPLTTTESVTTTKPLTTTESVTTTKPLRTTESVTTTKPLTTTESVTTTKPLTTTESVTTSEPRATTESVTTTEPRTTTDYVTTTKPLTTTESVTTTEPLTTTESVTTTEPLTTTELVTTTEAVTTKEPVTTTETLTTTEYVTTSEPLTTTESVTITEAVTITESVTTTEHATLTELATTPEHVTTTTAVATPEPVTTTESVTTIEPVTKTESVTTIEPVTTTESVTTTEPVISTESLATTELLTTKNAGSTTEHPPTLESVVTTHPQTSTKSVTTTEPLTTPEAVITTQPQTTTKSVTTTKLQTTAESVTTNKLLTTRKTEPLTSSKSVITQEPESFTSAKTITTTETVTTTEPQTTPGSVITTQPQTTTRSVTTRIPVTSSNSQTTQEPLTTIEPVTTTKPLPSTTSVTSTEPITTASDTTTDLLTTTLGKSSTSSSGLVDTSRQFEASVTMDKTWNPAYANSSSTEYLDLQKNFTKQLTNMYENTTIKDDIENVTITGFRNGSVITDYIIELKPGTTESETTITNITKEAVENIKSNPSPDFDLIKLINTDKIVVEEVIAKTTSQPDETTQSTTQSVETTDNLEPLIIGIGAVGGVIILGIGICIIICCMRSRKTSQNADKTNKSYLNRDDGHINHGMIKDSVRESHSFNGFEGRTSNRQPIDPYRTSYGNSNNTNPAWYPAYNADTMFGSGGRHNEGFSS